MITNSTFSNDQETMELIDRYLLEQLDEIELKQFQDRMEQDFNLRSLVLDQKQEMRAVEDYSLNQTMNSFHEEALREKITKKRNPKWWALAASVLILIGILIWTVFNTGPSAENIFANNFKPDPGLPTVMGKTTGYEFYSGMVSYKQKKYAEAISLWQPLHIANPKNDTFTYFIGVAHLAEGEIQQAKKLLHLSNDKKESAFKGETRYYLALAYLKENKVEDAKEILKNSTSPDNIKLLEEINTLK